VEEEARLKAEAAVYINCFFSFAGSLRIHRNKNFASSHVKRLFKKLAMHMG